jgi:F0F1-type ATP synthase delta subunit
VVVVVPVEPEPETTVPEDTTPTTVETLPEETETEETLPDTTTETVPSETETETESGPSEEPSAEAEEIQDAIDDLPIDASPDEIAEIVGEALIDATTEEVAEVLSTIFEDATDEEVVAILSAVFENATSEDVVAILSETFADGATDEQVAAVTEALLMDGVTEEAVSTLVEVLESGAIDESQVEAVIDAILQEEINDEVATALATSAAVIQNITAEQATDIFESVPVGELSETEGAEIVAAVQDAPTDVKESFEEEINVFSGVFDIYVPLDSTIDVGTRRSVIAVNLVTSTVALASAAGGLPTPSSSTSTPKQDMAARKPEEEEEEGGAIEGEGPEWIKRISIYKYENGVRVMDWKNFTKKFIYGVMGSGFTLAGAVVMYFTLSGFTQQVALWGTSIAFACAMYLHMKEPDGD